MMRRSESSLRSLPHDSMYTINEHVSELPPPERTPAPPFRVPLTPFQLL
jgi:hypothetical protein